MSAAGLISRPRGRAPDLLTAEQRARAYPFHNMPIVVAGRPYKAEGSEWEPEPQPEKEEPCVKPAPQRS